MAFFRAFIDDSAAETGDRRLFMAGYLNRADQWARFSEAWDEELHASPSIEYLKMNEAQNLKEQFRGWREDDRDKKLRALARVIRQFEPFSFQFSLNREQYYRIVRPATPRGFGNPHFMACFGIVSGLARFATAQKSKTPIEFIFDQQDGVSDDVDVFFDYLTDSLPRASRRLINGKPIFRDDKEFLPLQAADMLAWHIRREHEYGSNLPMADLLRCSRGHLVSELPLEMMERWHRHGSQLPGITQVQGKSQWREARQAVAQFSALGLTPPYGNRWKNWLWRIRDFMARRLLGR